jgi:hypothetical protein
VTAVLLCAAVNGKEMADSIFWRLAAEYNYIFGIFFEAAEYVVRLSLASFIPLKIIWAAKKRPVSCSVIAHVQWSWWWYGRDLG